MAQIFKNMQSNLLQSRTQFELKMDATVDA